MRARPCVSLQFDRAAHEPAHVPVDCQPPSHLQPVSPIFAYFRWPEDSRFAGFFVSLSRRGLMRLPDGMLRAGFVRQTGAAARDASRGDILRRRVLGGRGLLQHGPVVLCGQAVR